MQGSLAIAIVSLFFVGCSSNREYFDAKVEGKRKYEYAVADKVTASFERGIEAHGENETIERSLARVREEMKDPESAKIRNTKVKTHHWYRLLCGEINGKNNYGAYTGYMPFIASPDVAMVGEPSSITAGGKELYGNLVFKICAKEQQ